MEPSPEPENLQSSPWLLGNLRSLSPTIAFIIVSFSLGELVRGRLPFLLM